MQPAGQPVRRGPYVCLAAQCDLLGYVGHTAHPFAAITAETVIGRTSERIRFDTPTPHTIQCIERGLAQYNNKNKEEKEDEGEEVVGQREVPAMRVSPFVSEAMWPSVHAWMQKAREAHEAARANKSIAAKGSAALLTRNASSPLLLSSLWPSGQSAPLPLRATFLASGPQLARDAYRYDFHHRLPAGDAGAEQTEVVAGRDEEASRREVDEGRSSRQYAVHPALLRRVFLQALLILQLPNRSPAARFALHTLRTSPDLAAIENEGRDDGHGGLLRFSVLPFAATAAAAAMKSLVGDAQPTMYELRTRNAPAEAAAQDGNVVRGYATCVRVSSTTHARSLTYSTMEAAEMNAVLAGKTMLADVSSGPHYASLDELLCTSVLPHLLTHHATISTITTTATTTSESTNDGSAPEEEAVSKTQPQLNTQALLGALQRSAFALYACVAHCTWCEAVGHVVSAALKASRSISLLSKPGTQGNKVPWQSLLLFASCTTTQASRSHVGDDDDVCRIAWHVVVCVTSCDATLRWRCDDGRVSEGTLDALRDVLTR